MDYTAHVNNLAFLEVLNVLLAMATCTQKTQVPAPIKDLQTTPQGSNDP